MICGEQMDRNLAILLTFFVAATLLAGALHAHMSSADPIVPDGPTVLESEINALGQYVPIELNVSLDDNNVEIPEIPAEDMSIDLPEDI